MNKIKSFLNILVLLFIISFTYMLNMNSAFAETDPTNSITKGPRWSDSEDDKQWLTIKMPDGGIRIVDQKNQQEFLAIDSFGGIYLNGDIYVKGKMLGEFASSSKTSENVYNRDNVILIYISTILVFLSILIVIMYLYKRSVDTLSKKIDLLESNFREDS